MALVALRLCGGRLGAGGGAEQGAAVKTDIYR